MDLVTHLREDYLLTVGLHDERSNVVLSPVNLQDGRTVYKNSNYFNWVYYIPTGVTANFPPIVRDGSGVVPTSRYSVNYRRGEIEFDSTYPIVGTVNADFSTMRYVVAMSMSEIFDLADAPLSYIVIKKFTIREQGLQLGGGVWQNCDFIIEVASYSRNAYIAKARTDDVVELVKRGICNIPLVDYDTSFPLDFKGDRILAYDRDAQTTNSGTTDPCIYRVIENSVIDTDIPDFEDTRDYARATIMFTLIATADTE
jgi:hypothetical protein